jgi:hypothetical protein
MSNIEERHPDVLHNIEFAIVSVSRAEPALIDVDAQDAVDALVRHYGAEREGRQPPATRLDGRAERVFHAVREMCEWHLGRGRLSGLDEMPGTPIPIAGLVEGLRRIQKSIRLWSREAGRRRYLGFVSQYVR